MILSDYCFVLTSKKDGTVSRCVIRDCRPDHALVRCRLMYSPDLYDCRLVPAAEKLPFTELGGDFYGKPENEP